MRSHVSRGWEFNEANVVKRLLGADYMENLSPGRNLNSPKLAEKSAPHSYETLVKSDLSLYDKNFSPSYSGEISARQNGLKFPICF